MKKLLAAIISTALLSLIVKPANAEIQTLQSTYANLIDESITVSVNSNGSYTYCISPEQLSSIKTSASLISDKQSISDNNLNNLVLSALGYSELEIETLSASGIDDFAGTDWIVKNTTYYRCDSLTGESIIISEAEYKQLQNMNDNNLTAAVNSGGQSSLYTADGLYSISVLAEYLPNYIRDDWEDVEEDGWFRFTGTVYHNYTAFSKYQDAISLYADPTNISWGDTSSDFSSSMSYWIGGTEPTVTTKVSADRYIGIGGAYYVWEFPPITEISVCIKGYGRVCNYNNACVFDIYTGYVDYFEEPDTDFSFSFGTGGVGVSVSHGNEECANEYYGRCQVSYNP